MHRRTHFILIAVFACTWLLRTVGHAQPPQPSASTAEALALIPPDAIALLTVQPRMILQDEAMKFMPLEVMTASGNEQFGIDPLKIERIDVIIGLPAPMGPQVTALVTYVEDMSPDQVKGRAILDLTPGIGEGLSYFRDARHFLIGNHAYTERLLKTKLADGDLRRLAGKLGEPGQLSLVVALQPMRDMLVGLSQMPQIPEPIAPQVATLANKLTMLALRIQIGSKPMTALALEATDESDLDAVEASWKRIVQFGIGMARQQYERELRADTSPVALATQAYVQRVAVEIERQLNPTRKGNRLVMRVDANQQRVAQTGVLVGLLLPAIQAARESARRAQSSNNLRQLVLAALNYESTYKRFPGGGQPDPQTKSLLSWRVQILPFIEQKQLYDEFHHDEPWDSEHNIKLLPRMPATYKHPQSSAGPGMTVYQMSVGENLAGEDGRGIKFSEILDGSSNTVLMVETTDEAAVPWTKPADINPLADREKLRYTRGLLQAALVDGSVQNLPANIPAERFKALLTRNQGDSVRP
jgi:hypothetical protein